MSDDERLKLIPSDQVVYLTDLGEERHVTVTSPPWQLGHGEWVIGLEGVPGGYLLSRVIRRDRPELFADSPTMAEIKRLRAALEIIAACRHVSGSAQGAFRSNLRIADAALAGADLSDVDVVEAVCGGTWKRN